MRRMLRGSLVGGISGVLLTVGAAHASDENNEGYRSQQPIEEVVVKTKRRRAESTQQMTEAVSAFSGMELEREQAISLKDFNHSIPNVQLEHVGLFQAAASFSMRGLGTSGIESFDDPVVSVFVDNAYYSRNAVGLLNLWDVESVLALRGPQGTLYGRNAFAGAIVVQTNRPNLAEYEGALKADFGNYGRRNFAVTGNAPIVRDKLGLRLAAQYSEHDGFVENDGVVVESFAPGNLQTTIDENLKGTHHNGKQQLLVRPSLRWRPNEAFRVDVIGEYWRDRSDGTTNFSQCFEPGSFPAPLGNGPSGQPSAFEALGFPCKDPFGDERFGIEGDGSDPYEFSFGRPIDQTDQDIWGVTIDAEYDTGIGTFTLVANHREVNEDITTDTDGFNFAAFSSARLQQYKSSQMELRYNTAVGEHFDVLGGLFFLRDRYRVAQYLWIPPNSELFGGRGFVRENPNVSFGVNGQDRFSTAAYYEVTWHPGMAPKWAITVGGRYSYEKKSDVYGMAINQSTCPAGETPATFNCNGVPFSGNDPGNAFDFDPSVLFGPQEDDWSNFSPSVRVQYQVVENAMLFAFWQRAFKSGGFVNNAGTAPVFNSPYEPEQVDNFEIGIKSDWFNNRLRLNVNAFHAEYKDLQRTVIRAAPTTTGQETFTDNAAGATSNGVEVGFSAVPISNLTLKGQIGYLDIAYDSFRADLTGDGVITDNSDLELVRAPTWDTFFEANYRFELGPYGSLTAGAGVSYTDELQTQATNFVRSNREELTTIDAQLNWMSPDTRYRVSLWGKNLTDNVERLSATSVGSLFTFSSPTVPREYGLTLNVEL